jgi:predicted nucleic acid-binding protein
MKTPFRVVPDTNVFIAAEKSSHVTSPNKEFVKRWKDNEFEVLYSEDMFLEYVSEMRKMRITEASIRKLIATLFELGRQVRIRFYHLPLYPIDADDIAFLLCAENGEATHIISYDSHLKAIEPLYPFKVCNTPEFLDELRKKLLN